MREGGLGKLGCLEGPRDGGGGGGAFRALSALLSIPNAGTDTPALERLDVACSFTCPSEAWLEGGCAVYAGGGDGAD